MVRRNYIQIGNERILEESLNGNVFIRLLLVGSTYKLQSYTYVDGKRTPLKIGIVPENMVPQMREKFIGSKRPGVESLTENS